MSTDPHSTVVGSISPPPKTLEKDSAAESSDPAIEAGAPEKVEEEEEEEEEGECGFCVFMKGGGCKDEFVAWEECIEAAEKGKEDIAEKCFQATSLLRKCMEANAEYYEPVLKAEKAAEEVATLEVEKEMAEKEEKAQRATGSNSDGASSSGKQDAD